MPLFYFFANLLFRSLFLESPHVVHHVPHICIRNLLVISRHLTATEFCLVEMFAISLFLILRA
jgi:hypothetical protein